MWKYVCFELEYIFPVWFNNVGRLKGETVTGRYTKLCSISTLKFDFDELKLNRVQGGVNKLSEVMTYLNVPNIEMNEAVKSDLQNLHR